MPKWSNYSILATPNSNTRVCVIDGNTPQNMTIGVEDLFTELIKKNKLKSWEEYADNNKDLIIPATLVYDLKKKLDEFPANFSDTTANKLIISSVMPLVHSVGTEWLCLEDGRKYTFLDNNTVIEF